MRISQQILAYLKAADESPGKIAEATSLSKGNLYRAINGDRQLGRTEIDALAEYFGVRLTKPRGKR